MPLDDYNAVDFCFAPSLTVRRYITWEFVGSYLPFLASLSRFGLFVTVEEHGNGRFDNRISWWVTNVVYFFF